MDGTPRLRPTPEFREKWRRRADAAFERMYGGKNQEQLVPMTEREDMAVLIAKELAAFLLEEPIALDPAVCPDEAAPPCCPKCGSDPQPEPPAKFLEPTTAARLALEVKSRGKPALGRQPATPVAQRKKRKKNKRRIHKRVRTVVATMADSETFGWQMAAEVQRRGLDRAKRKACVCDGQKYNWTRFELHLLPLGFFSILDFLHLLAYLYDAAHALHGKDKAAGWKCYEPWLRWAWSGQVTTLLRSLRAGAARLAKAA